MARTHSRSLDAGGLNWDSLPMKLFAGGNAKFWNPADIDFSHDRADWEPLTENCSTRSWLPWKSCGPTTKPTFAAATSISMQPTASRSTYRSDSIAAFTKIYG